VPSAYKTGVVKCRIIYDREIHTVTYEHYKIKHIQSVKIVHAPSIEYLHKYQDRKALDALYQKKGNCDDIIIVKNGKITDSYYSNLAFLKNGMWYTPAHSLLDGTMRTLLLEKKKIKAKQILLEEIRTYESISFFNAMIPFKQVVIATESVDPIVIK